MALIFCLVLIRENSLNPRNTCAFAAGADIRVLLIKNLRKYTETHIQGQDDENHITIHIKCSGN